MDKEKETAQVKWYYKPITILIAILAVGPLAIPLILMSPSLKRWQKAVITALIILFTIWLVKASVNVAQTVQQQMQELQMIMK